MRITKVIIENYRSIKHLEIDFKPLMGLIGANSAGKSNILRAINLVLGERYPMAHSLSRKDFYGENYSNNIKIEIHFDEPFVSYTKDCRGISFATKYNSDGSFDTELKAIECSNSTCQRWNMKGETKEQIPVMYIPAARNFDKQLQSGSDWSFLGKIIKSFNELFPIERLEELKTKFNEVKTTLEIPQFKEFELTFKESFNEHVLPTENQVDIEFKAFNPKNYYKTIEIIPTEYGNLKDIDQMGEGMKNLIFLALLRAYAKIFPKSSIFLIEEPELFLHPQGRSDLYNVFKNLTENGAQIIYCTHSQEFIDIEYLANIARVDKTKSGTEHHTSVIQIKEADFLEKWKTQTGIQNITLDSIKLFLKNISNAETNKAFFANKIVLVEGNTEKWLLPIYAKKEELDLEKKNIEIVNVNGKNNIEKFYLLFKELGYLVYILFDGDKSKVEGEPINKKLTLLLLGVEKSWPTTQVSNKGTVFEENIEEELKKQISNFEQLKTEAKTIYGLKEERSKEIVARHIADKTSCPDIIKQVFEKIKTLEA